jgi:shikimate dehydrogenase
MGVRREGYAGFLPNLFKLTNIRGALLTTPHKMTALSLVDEVSTSAKIAGACNAILAKMGRAGDIGTVLFAA